MEKDFNDMTDEELELERLKWIKHVDEAIGWSSAYFTAKCLKAVCEIGNSRGLSIINPHPIKIG